ncbi:MAG: C-GCAxxG-C-C family protein [Acholeplasmatales bacterium]|nr:C-GCAxxG-C-C family protein [Acholeplasmatales bacterium]
MDNKIEYALNLKHTRCNCAQAVIMAYQDELGLTEEQICAIGSGFGTGMGNTKGVCGALIGATIVAGLLNKSGVNTKLIASDMMDRFIEESKALYCGDLKGVKTHQMLTSCDDCITNAIKILDDTLLNINK